MRMVDVHRDNLARKIARMMNAPIHTMIMPMDSGVRFTGWASAAFGRFERQFWPT